MRDVYIGVGDSRSVTCLAQNLSHALVMRHLSKVGSTGQCMCHPHEAWTILFYRPTNQVPYGGSLPVFTFCSSVVRCLHSGTLCTIIEANRSWVGRDEPTMVAAKAELRGWTRPLPWPKPGVGPFPGLANFLLSAEFESRVLHSVRFSRTRPSLFHGIRLCNKDLGSGTRPGVGPFEAKL